MGERTEQKTIRCRASQGGGSCEARCREEGGGGGARGGGKGRKRLGGGRGKRSARGYDAVGSSSKRKAASPILKSEDEQLKNRDRHSMIGATRDLARHFAVVAWAIRKHLDYVSMFDFQSRTGNTALTAHIDRLKREWPRPQT